MAARRNILYVLGIIALIVMPTVMSLGYYVVTKDPNLRPLGVTQQALSAYDRGRPTEQIHIVAQVEWVPARAGGYSQRALELAIVNAFKAKGVEVFVFFHPGVDATRVTYRVGHTTIGPYSVARAARGISAAVEAFHMHVPIN
ncbi:hypothetical protein [uncultured Maritimibacter sp.]|uniref:hypothetical protein n=1 Tax=uncultured Maritimibacter sp. TaxID=991866 RepID=UPI002597C9D3|nr:hypothetical protein [uncultured Maritimibacter sp.]